MPNIYIAAGSNVDPERHLTMAVRELHKVFPDVRFSSWYRNRAVGFVGQDFLNCVAAFTSELPVHAVVEHLHAIETLCGRPRDAPRWAPRTMDLDVLLYDDLVCNEPKLKLPRPDLLKRAYVLGPLAELAPQVLHPTAQLTIGELWERFDRAAHPMQRLPAAGITNPHSGPRRQPESGR
ncbi:MAG: 2-amino-4-hydroxy-6-hydroxymethyldihydropteridine diphosphokinase [Steroidobacteraceae bacterium]